MTESCVVGQHGGRINSKCRLEVQRITGTKMRHRQQTHAAMHRAVEGCDVDPFQQSGHRPLGKTFSDSDAPELGFEQVAGKQHIRGLIQPYEQSVTPWLFDEQSGERRSVDVNDPHRCHSRSSWR